MSGATAVSAVIVSYNTREHLLRCLGSLRDRVTLALDVIVVDNGSADGSAEAVRREFPAARVIASPDNLGFSRANNLGLREAGAPYVLLLNPDAEVRSGAVETMVAVLEARGDVGMVGPRTLGEDGTPQLSFGPALTPIAEWRQRRLVLGVRERRPETLARVEAMAAREQEPAWVSGSCMLARRAALVAVGGFDEGFFLYEEDVDLCVRLKRAGWRTVYAPGAVVVHHLGRSMAQSPARAQIEYQRSHLRYYRKHNGGLLTAVLRAWIAGASAAAWLAALGPGADRGSRRADAAAALRVALSLKDS